MSVPANGNMLLAGGDDSYQISRSVRTRRSASGYFSRTPASTSNRRTWTWSGWIKRGALTVSDTGGVIGIFGAGTLGTGNANFQVYWNSDHTFYLQETVQNVSNQLLWTSTPVYRDPTAWYHIVVAMDVTQTTASNKLKLYVNGVLQSGSFSVTPGTTTDLSINNSVAHYIGGAPINPNAYGNVLTYHDGYFSDVYFVDGQQLTPSSFGATDAVTGVWNPIRYTGTYGTYGYYLNFSDNSAATAAAIGKDSSGNGNNWTPNNISVTTGVTYDSMVDSPTNYGSDTGVGGTVRGSYCTLNPLENPYGFTLSGGNLDLSGANAWRGTRATIGVTSGKWYWEYIHTSSTAGGGTGISTQSGYTWSQMNTNDMGSYSGGWEYIYTGQKANNGSYVAYGAAFTQNDVVGVAFDADAGTLTFYKNGVSQGTAYTGLTSGPYFPTDAGAFGGNTYNFGQRPFAYTAPSGYKALCTQNLPTPTITNGANHMAATTYTGTGASQTVSNAVNSISFQPDWVWIKSRSAATDHKLTDSVRGTTKALISDTTGAETTDTNGLTAFGSSGFTVGTDTVYNNSGATYVGWQWKGGGTAVTNTNGTITSSVSANTTAGFSILTYTGNGTVGATVGHGLGVTPGMVIVKSRSAVTDWPVKILPYMTGGQRLELSTTNSSTTEGAGSGSLWNATNPNSTVITLGNHAMTNANGTTYVAYCWAQITGYSAFGSYTGNGSSDGPFIYCGFRPRWVMLKRTDAANHWIMYDTSRDAYNVGERWLRANTADTEATGIYWDGVSNGFKIRSTDVATNGSGGTYIYAAFAETPFTLARAR